MVFINIRPLLSCATDYSPLIKESTINNLSEDRLTMRNRTYGRRDLAILTYVKFKLFRHGGISLLSLKSSLGRDHWKYSWDPISSTQQTHKLELTMSYKGSTRSVRRKDSLDWGHESWVTVRCSINHRLSTVWFAL